MHHLDLYRLAGPSDLGRLNLEETFASGICLIEWAERLEELAPAAHLGIQLRVLSEVHCTSHFQTISHHRAVGCQVPGCVLLHTAHIYEHGQTLVLGWCQEEQERLQCHSGTEEHACPASSKPAEEDADSAYVDTQWRHITLVSHEHTWSDRLQDLASAACRAGLLILPKPGERMQDLGRKKPAL